MALGTAPSFVGELQWLGWKSVVAIVGEKGFVGAIVLSGLCSGCFGVIGGA